MGLSDCCLSASIVSSGPTRGHMLRKLVGPHTGPMYRFTTAKAIHGDNDRDRSDS
jgi:hypothetical protein